jgi:hypothetical protein
MKEEKAQCAHIQRKKRMSERNSREREKTSLFRSLIEVTEERNVDSRKMNKMKNKNLWKWKRKFNVRFGSSSNNNNILSDLICFFFSSLYSGVMHNTKRKRERERKAQSSACNIFNIFSMCEYLYHSCMIVFNPLNKNLCVYMLRELSARRVIIICVTGGERENPLVHYDNESGLTRHSSHV